MFSLFRRSKGPPPYPVPAPGAAPKGLLRPEPAATLLATPRRQKLLEHIWQRTSLSRAQFATLYRAPIERYAALVQQFPASESHHHAYPGGMLDHGLEIVAYVLKLRQSRLLPVGAQPEIQAAQAEAWTATTAYAALLHDIGKIAVDLDVEYADGERWYPWHGPLARAYRFRYRKDRSYRLHEAAAGLLYTQILDHHIMDWLSGFPELWSALLYVLTGHKDQAGVLGELVTQADQASVAQELGGNPQKALLAPKQALQRKLLDGLRHLVRNELKLNQPQASDGWLTNEGLWLPSPTSYAPIYYRRELKAYPKATRRCSMYFRSTESCNQPRTARPSGRLPSRARMAGRRALLSSSSHLSRYGIPLTDLLHFPVRCMSSKMPILLAIRPEKRRQRRQPLSLAIRRHRQQ